jgi:ABC-type transporter Mla subunit MlaD
MTEQTTPPTDPRPADEPFTWGTDPGATPGAGKGAHDDASGSAGASGGPSHGASATATGVLESLRDAIDDLTERATPAVREYSARAAELAAVAADRAAPLAKRAGEATADASGKLAAKSRIWASDLRASLATNQAEGPAAETDPAGETPAPPATSVDDRVTGTDDTDGPASA